MVHASGVENKPTSAENQNSQSLIRTTSSSTAATSSQQVPEELAAPAPPPVSPLPNDPSAESQNCTPTFPAWPVNESQPSQVTIPPHQQKFLKFAGKNMCYYWIDKVSLLNNTSNCNFNHFPLSVISLMILRKIDMF